MNSVALPASASSGVLGAEADLVRQAARGDAGAFSELFRRHSAPAWRLAQAVTADRDSAVAAFKDGFVRSLREGRRPRRGAPAFRPQVLAAVYRAAIDQTFDRAGRPATPRRASADGPEAALAEAAFRSLPERWRAAVWLREVEHLDNERIAAVLSVSVTVAEQLIARGRRGLAGRYAQARHELPEHVGEVLRAVAVAMPANLSDVASARWSASGADPMPILAPITAWLEERAVRPMSVVVGALLGLGLVGLGVVGGAPSVRSQLGTSAAGNLPGSVPVTTCLGVVCPAGTGPTAAHGSAGTAGFFGGGGFLSTGLTNSAGGNTAASGAGGSTVGTGLGGGPFGSVPGSGYAGGPGGGGGGTPGGGGGPTPGGTTLSVPGIATVTLSSSGLDLSLLNGKIRCSTSGAGCTTSTGPTSQPANPVTSAVQQTTKAVQTTTSNITSSVVSTTTKALAPVSGSPTGTTGSTTGSGAGTGTTTGSATGTVSNTTQTVTSLAGSLTHGL